MEDIFVKQYEEIVRARMVMLLFIEENLEAKFKDSLALFDNKSPCDLLIHTANTYVYWLAIFALKETHMYWDVGKISKIIDVFKIYDQVDKIVNRFLSFLENGYESNEFHGTLLDGQKVCLGSIKIFTHVITHEFHHKGQIMTMCRFQGFVPPDTDIIRN